MGTIHRPYDSGSRGTEVTAFIQCINGRDPQIDELWCLGLDGIICKVHPTAHAYVTDGTVRDFFTYYLAENECKIDIIGKISVNDRVQFLGFSEKAWGSGLPFICNLLALIEATGWGSGH